MLGASTTPLRNYPYSLWTTWLLSYNAVAKQNPKAANLLLFWSYLSRIDIDFAAFEGSFRTKFQGPFSSLLGNMTMERAEFFEAKRLLRSFSLISATEQGQGQIIHPVVHHWAYCFQTLHQRYEIIRLVVMMVGHAVPNSDVSGYPHRMLQLFPHAEICVSRWFDICKMVGDLKESSEKPMLHLMSDTKQVYVLRGLQRLGRLFVYHGRYHEAEALYHQVLEGKETAFGIDAETTLNTVSAMGCLHTSQAKYSLARDLFLRSFNGYQKILGATDDRTLRESGHLGNTYKVLKEFDAASALLSKTLDQMKEAYGPSHENTIHAMDALGNLYIVQGKLSEAESILTECLEIAHRSLNPKHLKIYNIKGNLASLLAKQGRLPEAQILYEEELRGYEEALGPQIVIIHGPTLKALRKLGDLHIIEKQYKTAESLYKKALEGFERTQDSTSQDCTYLRKRLLRIANELSNANLVVLDSGVPTTSQEGAEEMSFSAPAYAQNISL